MQADEGADVLREPATDEPPAVSGEGSISASLSTELDRTRTTSSGATHARAQPALPCLSFLSPFPLWQENGDH